MVGGCCRIDFEQLSLWIVGVEKAVTGRPTVEVDGAEAADKAEKRIGVRFRNCDIVAGIHDDTRAAGGLGVGDGERFHLHVVAKGAGADIAGGRHVVDRFAPGQLDEKVEPVDAGIDDVPAAALDFDQFQLADFAAADTFENLAAVVCHEEAMRYNQGQVSGADEFEQLAAVGMVVGERFFDEDALEREMQGRTRHLQMGGRPGGDADNVGRA